MWPLGSVEGDYKERGFDIFCAHLAILTMLVGMFLFLCGMEKKYVRWIFCFAAMSLLAYVAATVFGFQDRSFLYYKFNP